MTRPVVGGYDGGGGVTPPVSAPRPAPPAPHPVRRSLRPLAALAAVLVLPACEAGWPSTEPTEPRGAGVYVLQAVSGRGPATGSTILRPDGTAERRVRYAEDGARLSAEHVAHGTYALRPDGTLRLRLREDAGRSPHVWEPAARLVADELELRHPDPADGPDIVERYRRL